jgi:hypothetical protein
MLRDPCRLRAAAINRLQVRAASVSRLHDVRWKLRSRQALAPALSLA